MSVRRIATWEAAEEIRDRWNELSQRTPFRQWEWLGTWWEHFGAGREWYVAAVFDDKGTMVALAPWFVRRFPGWGRVIQFLGSGEVCSDYLSVLCHPAHTTDAADELAEWLVTVHGESERDAWDMLSLEGVPCEDLFIRRLLDALRQRDCTVHCQPGGHVWRIPLPATWDDYLGQLSKPNRRHIRTLQKRLVQTRMVETRRAETPDEFMRAWNLFTSLHQRRRRMLGQPGCFANPVFEQFLCQSAQKFLAIGCLELTWVTYENRPMAAQLALLDEHTTYAYQVGIDPEMLVHSPGWLVHSESIRHAIHHGRTGFDFLRGDERYKQHLGAQRCDMMSVRVAPPRVGPKILNRALVTGTAVKNWIKNHLMMPDTH